MSERPPHNAPQLPEPTVRIENGWHCLHIYYKIDQASYKYLTHEEIESGKSQLCELLAKDREGLPERTQLCAVTGHRADLGVIMMDHDPLKIDKVVQEIRSTDLGTVFKPTYSFVSISEISEYVPSVEQYAERLKLEGMSPDDPAYAARVKGYEQRLPMMNEQRLYPSFPDYPVVCFYPMNKIRDPHANWYTLPFSKRSALMAEHAVSGIKFAGKVSQFISASTGFDDWEWGVTLWGRVPEYIKDIVYTMRFDEASAKYAEFGPFYIGYVMSIEEALEHYKL